MATISEGIGVGIALFGTYRWILAMMVAYSHVGRYHHMCGAFAVFAFFLLSGYLITRVLAESYGRRRDGIAAFYMNRAMRIYPPYWVAIAFTALIVQHGMHTPLDPEMVMPVTATQWLKNIVIFGCAMPDGTLLDQRLISVVWSLSIELTFYLALPLLVLNNVTCAVWMAASAIILAGCALGNLPFAFRYFSVYAVSPVYALGAALYLFRDKLPRLPFVAGLPVMALTLSICLLPAAFSQNILTHEFYLVLMLNVLIVHCLSRLNVPRDSCVLRCDQFLGALSYPIFLLHLPLAQAIKLLTGNLFDIYTIPFFLITAVGVNIAAFVLHWCVEEPLERLRRRIRRGGLRMIEQAAAPHPVGSESRPDRQ